MLPAGAQLWGPLDGTLHRARARRRSPPGRNASFAICVGFIPLCTPCPQPKALETLARSLIRSRGLVPDSPCLSLKLSDSGPLSDGCWGPQENPAAPPTPFLLSVHLHRQLPPKDGPHHQITRLSIFKMEMTASSLQRLGEMHVEHLAQSLATTEHALILPIPRPLARVFWVSRSVLSFRKVLGNAHTWGGGL